MNNKVSVVKCDRYSEVQNAVEDFFGPVGVLQLMPVGIFNGLRRFDVCVCRDCKDRCGVVIVAHFAPAGCLEIIQ